jgi:hypothetical protein
MLADMTADLPIRAEVVEEARIDGGRLVRLFVKMEEYICACYD